MKIGEWPKGRPRQKWKDRVDKELEVLCIQNGVDLSKEREIVEDKRLLLRWA